MTQTKYPCTECGKLRTKDEGGTTFTLCDECWEKHYGKQPTEARQDELAGIRYKWQAMFCQHCKAMQKTNDTVVECWYNPLDHGNDKAFCASNCDAIDSFFALTVSSGGGICPHCQGEKTMWGGGNSSDFVRCHNCNGTGQKPIVTKTVGEIIEEWKRN